MGQDIKLSVTPRIFELFNFFLNLKISAEKSRKIVILRKKSKNQRKGFKNER